MSKRYYETTFIVDSILEDDKVDSIITRYTTFFSKNSGEVVKTNTWGRKKLTYPIKKRTTGSYISIEFTAEPSIIAKLERAYHLDDEVLRFLTVSFDKKSLETRNTYLARKAADEKARAEAKLELLRQAENPAVEVIPDLNIQPLSTDQAGLTAHDSDESKTRGATKAVDAEAKEKEKSE